MYRMNQLLRTLRNSTREVAFVMCLTYLSASNGLSQSSFPIANGFELDPPLGGVWVVIDEQNPITVSFTKLESSDLDVQLDELRRINKYAALVKSGEKESVLKWCLERLEELGQENQSRGHSTPRLLLQALITAIGNLGSNENAEALWSIAQKRPELSLLIERILIDWGNQLPLSTWRSRVAQFQGDWQAVSIAIRGMEILQDYAAVDDLVTLFSKPNLPLPIKIEASRVLGILKSTGLEALAQEVYESNSDFTDLIAGNLIAQHNSKQALELQLAILNSDQAASVSIAFESISKFHPKQGEVLAADLINHKEFHVRRLAIENLSKSPIEANLRLLAGVFRDQNVGLRDQARQSLVDLANSPEVRPVVDKIVDEEIVADDRRVLEQAIILAVQLNRRDVCVSLLKHLNHEDEIVKIRAAWGLQELASDEMVLSRILELVKSFSERLKEGTGINPTERFQLTYLIHAFGSNRYLPAEPLLREYVPEMEQKMTPHARAAAIWALGMIHQGSKDATLSAQIEERFFDLGPPFAEYENVRYTSAITLARLGAMEDPSSLRTAGGSLPYKMGVVVNWAIENHGKLPKP